MESRRSSTAILACVCLLGLSLALVASLGACSPLPVAVEPPAPDATAVPAVVTTLPRATPTAAAPTEAAPSTAALQAMLEASLAPMPTPEPGSAPVAEPLEVVVLPLESDMLGQPLWAAYTAGMGFYSVEQDPFVAIYGYDQDTWQELGRAVLTSCAEYIGSDSLVQVPLEPSRVWLELHSGTGAHSGCYDLMSFDGQELRLEASHFSSSPGAGATTDLTGDGLQEVVLDLTESYVFCYACGVRLPMYQVLRWDGAQLVPVELGTLPETAPAEARALNDRAVALAGGELWRDARQVIAQAQALQAGDEAVREAIDWNAVLIELTGQARAEQALSGVYPILDQAFYGDYGAAVAPMRSYEPAEIWTLTSPLITGTVAEGWELALGDWLSWTTNLALGVEPDLAGAYFLRGWAAFLRDPAAGSAAALADVAQAAALEPGDAFYARNAAYLRAGQLGEDTVWQPPAAEACYALGEAMMQTLNMTVTLSAEPFQDYVGGGTGTACQAVVTGTGQDFQGFWQVAEEMAAALAARGWQDDGRYAADGPTGTARGLRLDDQLCLLSAGWQPALGADCPNDRPISECGLAPEQQLYTVVLSCAQAQPAE